MAMAEGMGVMPVYNLDNKNDGGGFGENGFIWILFLFVLLGFGRDGFGGGSQAASQISNDFLSNQVGQGFAQVTNQNFTTQKDLFQGFAGIGNAICDSTYALNNSIKDCCCATQKEILVSRYEADKNTCAITNAIHADGEATRALINTNTMQDLRDRLAATELGLSQAAQTANIVQLIKPCPVPAFTVPNPCAPYNPCGTC